MILELSDKYDTRLARWLSFMTSQGGGSEVPNFEFVECYVCKTAT